MAQQEQRRGQQTERGEGSARPSQGEGRHGMGEREQRAPQPPQQQDQYLAAGERASDEGTYVNMEPEDLEDRGYQSLEADAGDEDEIRDEADQFSVVNANEPLTEDVELAAPAEMMVEMPSGDLLEEEVAFPPESDRTRPSNADDPLIRAPDEVQPETQGRAPGDTDIESNWPDEGYYEPDDTPEREG